MRTGSLMNKLYAATTAPTPAIGMGATRLCWTDRRACTVVAITADGKTVVVQEDTATRTDNYGMSDCQSYSYEPDPKGRLGTYTLRKNGQWVLEGSGDKTGEVLLLGVRNHYHDFSF